MVADRQLGHTPETLVAMALCAYFDALIGLLSIAFQEQSNVRAGIRWACV